MINLFKAVSAVITIIGTSLVITGCGSQPDLPEVAVDQRFQDQDYMYVVGPGDSLAIFVWGNEELSSSATVRPDGKFTTRLVEDLEASGKTSTQLARDIEKAYSEYVRTPVVSVIVNGFVGVPEQQVRVVGEASQPISIPYRKHMTLLDLMIAVGGLTEYANGNKSGLVRYWGGTEESYGVRLDDLLQDGDISANLNLMPGDILIVTESWF